MYFLYSNYNNYFQFFSSLKSSHLSTTYNLYKIFREPVNNSIRRVWSRKDRVCQVCHEVGVVSALWRDLIVFVSMWRFSKPSTSLHFYHKTQTHRYLATVCGAEAETQVEKRVLASNPIMEVWGGVMEAREVWRCWGSKKSILLWLGDLSSLCLKQ